jgi:diketogulonate reductase-like aldo/keto reductase
MSVPGVDLGDGVTIPALGFGVFQVPPAETQAAVEAALAAGYRHLDTAAAYRNEAGVGAALRAAGLRRDDVFVTTKLRNAEQGRDASRAALGASLEQLGLDAVDLYLIHWPSPARGLYVETWQTLVALRDEGLARAVGVSNFLPEHLAALDAVGVRPAVNQIESHPTFQQPATVAASVERGIRVEAYSPLGRGADLEAAGIVAAAAAHGASAAQVVLAWHLQRGRIAIPKTVHPERMRENLAAAGLALTDAELAAIDALDSDERIGADPATAEFSQLDIARPR